MTGSTVEMTSFSTTEPAQFETRAPLLEENDMIRVFQEDELTVQKIKRLNKRQTMQLFERLGIKDAYGQHWDTIVGYELYGRHLCSDPGLPSGLQAVGLPYRACAYIRQIQRCITSLSELHLTYQRITLTLFQQKNHCIAVTNRQVCP